MEKLKKFLTENTIDGGLLQSKHWTQFKKESGAEVFEFEDGDNFRALVVEHKLPVVGKYWFIPRGPVVASQSEAMAGKPIISVATEKIRNSKFEIRNKSEIQNFNFKTEIQDILNTAKRNGVVWVRVEPQCSNNLGGIKKALDGKYKIVKSKKNHQPAQTVMVDLTGSEDEILMSMKHKTRYNIRLSDRKGVKIFETRKKENVEKFCDLLDETAERDRITNHPRKHYADLLNKIDKDVVKLYLAEYKGEIISGAMVSFYGKVATYLHGASSNQYRNVMSPFGLHWRIIQEAKKVGMRKYDLGGTRLVPGNRKKETGNSNLNQKTEIKDRPPLSSPLAKEWIPEEGSWQGITRFKQGFCPNEKPVEFPGCWDIILNPIRYKLYKFLQKLKDPR